DGPRLRLSRTRDPGSCALERKTGPLPARTAPFADVLKQNGSTFRRNRLPVRQTQPPPLSADPPHQPSRHQISRFFAASRLRGGSVPGLYHKDAKNHEGVILSRHASTSW